MGSAVILMKWFPDLLLSSLGQLVDSLTGFERILTTPIPFSYVNPKLFYSLLLTIIEQLFDPPMGRYGLLLLCSSKQALWFKIEFVFTDIPTAAPDMANLEVGDNT